MKQKQKQPQKKGIKHYLMQFWDFVWNGESLASWVVSILLAFVLIRFIFYPLLGLAIGTSMPIVAVISSSMEHTGQDWMNNPAYCTQGYCIQEEWYLEKGITPAEFSTFPFQKGFNKGDIMLIVGKNPEKIKVGDVIVFQANQNYPIIHRVVEITHGEDGKIYFGTKGDNNPTQIVSRDVDETSISQDRVQGVAKGRVPYLGYIKIVATQIITGVRSTFS